MALVRIAAFALVASTLVTSVDAQCPQWSRAFAGDGFDFKPAVLESLDDGSGSQLYAGGVFTTAGTESARYVARFDSSRWRALGDGTLGEVRALAIHDDGSGPALYAAGRFAASPDWCSFVQRWNGNAWSTIESGHGTSCEELVAFDDGNGPQLYAGISSEGHPLDSSRVIAWNGSSWSQVGPDFAGTLIDALAAHDDGSGPALYAGGGFTVRRLVGANWVQVGAGVGGSVYDLVSSPGALYAIGDFTLAGKKGVALWNGASWTSTGFPAGNPYKLQAGAMWNGALHVAGNLCGGVARYTGAGWLQVGASEGPTLALAAYDDGSGPGALLYAGGEFNDMSGARVQRVARFDGASWTRVSESQHALGVDPAISNEHHVRALVRWRDPVSHLERIVVGGDFAWTDDTPDSGTVVAWTGSRWSRLGDGLTGYVQQLTTYVDAASGEQRLVACGWLQLAGGGSATVTQFDGHEWTSLGAWSFAPHVYVARDPSTGHDALFTFSTPSIWKWDGSAWITIGNFTGSPTQPLGLASYDDPGPAPRHLYVVGNFVGIDGQSFDRAARWDGTNWSPLPAPLPFGAAPLILYTLSDSNGVEHLVTSPHFIEDASQWSFDGVQWTDRGYRPHELDTGSGLQSGVFEDDAAGRTFYSNTGWRWRFGLLEPYFATPPEARDRIAIERDAPGTPRAIWYPNAVSIAGTPARGVARWSDPCAAIASHCTAKINSLGCSAAIGWSGEPSIAAVATNPFVITASDVISGKAGLFFYGVSGPTARPFLGGTLCVLPPLRRGPLTSSGGAATPDCSGSLALDFSPWIQGANDPALDLGVRVDGQWWYRDGAASFSVGFSDALRFEIRP